MYLPTQDEVMAQVDRILTSKGFSGSDPMRNMLLYLASKATEHPGEAVKEFELATGALGKASSYDPRTDSTVRVVASRLRSKLVEYYAEDGAHDPLIVSIPKGSYLLVTTQRPAEPPAASTAEASALRLSVTRCTRRLFLTSGVTGILALLGGYYAGRRSLRPSVPVSTAQFWRHFVQEEAPIIVYSNPRFVGSIDKGMHLARPDSAQEGPVSWLYTGVGEVVAVRQISALLNVLGVEPRVKRARLFTWDDAKSNDLIFVGGQQQNLPMAQLPKMEKFNLKPEASEPFREHGGVQNEMPAQGEQTFYMSSDDLENGEEYAVIALTRGVVPDKRVLVLAGVRSLGTEAAATAVCNPNLLEELLRKLGANASSTVPFFEALIKVNVRGGAPLEPRLLSIHKRLETSVSKESRLRRPSPRQTAPRSAVHALPRQAPSNQYQPGLPQPAGIQPA
jgi:hypothetical protein